ncbi:hypothetical protein NUW58_g3224 [Xylaria curta]|uniref:Uncharacterized protein n=1 Tax=Xylaria curta TaxID=42375 RepID=A0ACC1PCG8_9PEZI|nr:hypothetical protein NUW58_g3224 [Xylaria curta]
MFTLQLSFRQASCAKPLPATPLRQPAKPPVKVSPAAKSSREDEDEDAEGEDDDMMDDDEEDAEGEIVVDDTMDIDAEGDDDDEGEEDAEGEDDDMDMSVIPPPAPVIKVSKPSTKKSGGGKSRATTKPSNSKAAASHAKESDDDEELSELESDADEIQDTVKVGGGDDEDAEGEDEEIEDAEPAEEDDLGSDEDGSQAETPDLTKMTKRQRARFEENSDALMKLSDEVQAKKHFTAEELSMRRAEMARRRRNLSEKRNEEVKMETINKLLKKQPPKTNRKGQAGLESTPDVEAQKPSPIFVRWSKFSYSRHNRLHPGRNTYHPLLLKRVIWHTDPFYAERRRSAMATYSENANDARWLKKEGIDLGWELLNRERREMLGGDTRICAIVKQLEKPTVRFHSGNGRRAWSSVCLLNNSKIYNMNIKAENFVVHQLVGFSSSWAELHKLLDYPE